MKRDPRRLLPDEDEEAAMDAATERFTLWFIAISLVVGIPLGLLVVQWLG